jgi:hypothetical protein
LFGKKVLRASIHNFSNTSEDNHILQASDKFQNTIIPEQELSREQRIALYKNFM